MENQKRFLDAKDFRKKFKNCAATDLGSMVEQQLIGAVAALKKRDIDASQVIIDTDEQINQRRYSIEEKVMIVIATQQPMAHDLRSLASILEIAGELERMGDYAKGIATINIRIKMTPFAKTVGDIPRMAQKDADILHRALTALLMRPLRQPKNST